jgi:hypothetical protein
VLVLSNSRSFQLSHRKSSLLFNSASIMRHNLNFLSPLLVLIQPTRHFSKGRGIRCSSNLMIAITVPELWRKHNCCFQQTFDRVVCEAVTAVTVEITVFWDAVTCTPPMFQRRILPPSSGSKNKLSKEPPRSRRQVALLSLLYDPECGSRMFLRNVGGLLPNYTPLRPSG